MKKCLTCCLIGLLAFQACDKDEKAEPGIEEIVIPPAREIIDDSPADYDNPNGEWTLSQIVAGDTIKHYTYAPGRKLMKVTFNYTWVYTLHYDGELLKKITVLPKLSPNMLAFDSIRYGYANGRMSNAELYYNRSIRYDTLLYNQEGKLQYVRSRFSDKNYKMFIQYDWDKDNVKTYAYYSVENNDKDTALLERSRYQYDQTSSPYRPNGNKFHFDWLTDNYHGYLISANNHIRETRGISSDSIVYSYKNGLPARAYAIKGSYQDGWKDVYFSYKKK